MKFIEVGKPKTNVRIPTIEQGPKQSAGARALASHLRQIATYLDQQAILIDLESEEAFDLENYRTEREKLYQSLETISFIDSE